MRSGLQRAQHPSRSDTAVVRVLVLAANPSGMAELALRLEVRGLREKIDASRRGGAVELTARWAIRYEDVRHALLEVEPHVVHFIGHGEREHIVLEDDRGEPSRVEIGVLADLLRILKGRIRLVVFNVCHSVRLANATAAHIDCVVGMAAPIADGDARTFAGALYEAIGFGRSVKEAFELAQNAIRLDHEDDIPLLVHRHAVDPGAIVLVPEPAPRSDAHQTATRDAPPGAAGAPRPAGEYDVQLVEADVPDPFRLRALLQREAALGADAAIAHIERALGGAPPVVARGLDHAQAAALLRALAAVGAVGTALGPERAPPLPRIERAESGLLLARVPGSEDGAIQPFRLSCRPVTQALYRRVMGSNPSRFRGDRRPVEGVRWDEALAFCERLSAMEPGGPPYRLPTPAEWEHAARAGEPHRYAGSSRWQEVAWARTDATRPVGRKRPNAWGLSDMSGNVFEWTCAEGDRTTRAPGARVVKGGCYASEERDLEIAAEREVPAGFRFGVGLRPARPEA